MLVEMADNSRHTLYFTLPHQIYDALFAQIQHRFEIQGEYVAYLSEIAIKKFKG